MKTIDLWRWLITDPGDERVPGSLEQRQVPASAEEAVGLQARTPRPGRG